MFTITLQNENTLEVVAVFTRSTRKAADNLIASYTSGRKSGYELAADTEIVLTNDARTVKVTHLSPLTKAGRKWRDMQQDYAMELVAAAAQNAHDTDGAKSDYHNDATPAQRLAWYSSAIATLEWLGEDAAQQARETDAADKAASRKYCF